MADDHTKNKPNTLERLGSSSTSSSGLDRFADQIRNYERTVNERRIELQRIENEIKRNQQLIATQNRFMGDRPYSAQYTAEELVKHDFSNTEAEYFGNMSRDDQRLALIKRSARIVDRANARDTELQQRRIEAIEIQQASVENTFQSSISHALSPENLAKDTRALSRAPGMRPGTQALAQRYTDTELRRLIEKNKAQQEATADQVLAASAGYGDEAGTARFHSEAYRLGRHINTGAALMAAVAMQKKQGLDLEGQFESAAHLATKVGGSKQLESIRDRIVSGQVGTMSQEGQKLGNLGNEFLSAFNKFKEAIDSTGDATKELREELDKTKTAYEDQEKLVREMGKAGGGGGDRPIDLARRGIGFFGQQLEAAQFAAVDSQTGNVAARAGIAALTNTRYFNALAATQGDMAALRRQTSSVYDQAAGNADELGRRTSTIKGAQVFAAATDFGLIATSGMLDKTGNGGLTSIATAPWDAARGAGGAIIDKGGGVLAGGIYNTADLLNNISSSNTRMASFNANVKLHDALNAVPDFTRQKFYDLKMAGHAQMVGAGSAGSRIFSTATGAGSLASMAAYGVNPEDTQALYGEAIRSIGAQFTNRPDGGRGIVDRAGAVQASGITSAQDYIRRIGQMTAVGGGQAQVEQILANAVARGVDNAKSFGDMVGAITSLSASNAARGVDVSFGATKAMLSGMDAYKSSSMSEDLKRNLVSTGINTAESITGDLGLNFPTMSRHSFLSANLKGVSRSGMVLATGMTGLQALSLESKFRNPKTTKEELRQAALNAGGYELMFDETGNVRSDAMDNLGIVRESAVKEMVASTAGIPGITPEDRKEIEEAARGRRGFSSLKGKLQAVLSSSTYGVGVGAAGLSYMFGGEPAEGLVNTTRGGELQDAQNIAVTGAEALNKTINDFTDSFRKMAGEQSPLAAIAGEMKTVSASLSAMVSAKQTVGAATDMKLDIGTFSTDVVSFHDAVKLLVDTIQNTRTNDPFRNMQITIPSGGVLPGEGF